MKEAKDMNKLERGAMIVFTGCILAMAAVLFVGMMQDKKDEEFDF